MCTEMHFVRYRTSCGVIVVRVCVKVSTMNNTTADWRTSIVAASRCFFVFFWTWKIVTLFSAVDFVIRAFTIDRVVGHDVVIYLPLEEVLGRTNISYTYCLLSDTSTLIDQIHILMTKRRLFVPGVLNKIPYKVRYFITLLFI